MTENLSTENICQLLDECTMSLRTTFDLTNEDIEMQSVHDVVTRLEKLSYDLYKYQLEKNNYEPKRQYDQDDQC